MTNKTENTPAVSLRENGILCLQGPFLDTYGLRELSYLRMSFNPKDHYLVISFGSDREEDGVKLSIRSERKEVLIFCATILHGAGFVFTGRRKGLEYEKTGTNTFKVFVPTKDQLMKRRVLEIVLQRPSLIKEIRTSLTIFCDDQEISEKDVRSILQSIQDTI